MNHNYYYCQYLACMCCKGTSGQEPPPLIHRQHLGECFSSGSVLWPPDLSTGVNAYFEGHSQGTREGLG